MLLGFRHDTDCGRAGLIDLAPLAPSGSQPSTKSLLNKCTQLDYNAPQAIPQHLLFEILTDMPARRRHSASLVGRKHNEERYRCTVTAGTLEIRFGT